MEVNNLDIVNNMAPPSQHVVHIMDGDIDLKDKSSSDSVDVWNKKKENIKKGFLLTSVVGLATYLQFKSSFALAAKKGDGSAISPVNIGQAELKWASKALGYGTLLALSGTGLVCFLIKKAMGVNSLVEFKDRMHEIFPQAKKSSTADDSEKIETVEDFIKYITKDKNNEPVLNPAKSDSEKT